MDGEPINELNEGVQLFFNSIRQDEIAKYSAEVSIVTFGSYAKKELDFASIDDQQVPYLNADGTTPMGEAVSLSLDLLDERKREYSNAGVDYYQPWLVLMTDGQPTDSIEHAVNRVSQMIENRKLTIFPIGIGDGADMAVLKRFSPQRDPLKLKGLNFRDFFEWLSQSVSCVSQSTPGEQVDLDVDGIKGWGTL